MGHAPSQFLPLFSMNATFRGNQEDVLKSIFSNDRYILQIAGTGVGKSLSFMLTALATNGGTSIVIVPLLALQLDLVSRCKALRINCSIWSDVDDYNFYDIIFITPESAISEKFMNYTNFLISHCLLDRIFIDEAHLLLTSTDTFRKKMGQLHILLQHTTVQIVLLTATLPEKN
jgi:superfamily II DNA helicase RecQ